MIEWVRAPAQAGVGYPDAVEIDQQGSGRRDGTRFAGRGGARLAFSADSGADRAAVPVVVLHELLSDRSAWATMREAVGGHGRPLLRPDARGHGASAAVAGRRVALGELAEDAAAVLDAEGVGGAHLVGLGLGGATAVAFAERYPGRVRSLVVIEPTLPGLLAEDGEAEARWVAGQARERLRVAADLADKGLTERALDAYLEPRLGAGWRERLPRARTGAIRRNAAALGPILGALEAYLPDPAALRAITAPVLLLRRASAGRQEVLIGERLAALLSRATAETVPDPADGRDLLEGETGEVVAARVAAFLGGIREP